jgi:hypothetical protein
MSCGAIGYVKIASLRLVRRGWPGTGEQGIMLDEDAVKQKEIGVAVHLEDQA